MVQPCRRPPLAHLQGASPDVLHEVVVAKDSYETPSWVWSHYVKSEALTVDVHASAFNAVAPRYITKADDPASLDEPLPRAKKLALGLSVPPSLSLAPCVSSPSCHLRATGCTASGCGSTLRTGASARASNRRWRAACARCASAGAGWWHCCLSTLSRRGELSSASNSLRLRRVLTLRLSRSGSTRTCSTRTKCTTCATRWRSLTRSWASRVSIRPRSLWRSGGRGLRPRCRRAGRRAWQHRAPPNPLRIYCGCAGAARAASGGCSRATRPLSRPPGPLSAASSGMRGVASCDAGHVVCSWV